MGEFEGTYFTHEKYSPQAKSACHVAPLSFIQCSKEGINTLRTGISILHRGAKLGSSQIYTRDDRSGLMVTWLYILRRILLYGPMVCQLGQISPWSICCTWIARFIFIKNYNITFDFKL
jgi:hypothetical protein